MFTWPDLLLQGIRVTCIMRLVRVVRKTESHDILCRDAGSGFKKLSLENFYPDYRRMNRLFRFVNQTCLICMDETQFDNFAWLSGKGIKPKRLPAICR
jgi:hypothetical protein